MPTRNGPTRWARRPPTAPKTTSGRANSVMPRLAIHSLVSRSSSTTDHSASNEPIITHTAQPSSDGAGERADAQQVERQALRRRLGRLVDAARVAHDERQGQRRSRRR